LGDSIKYDVRGVPAALPPLTFRTRSGAIAMLEHFRRLLRHMRWADQRVLDRLREGADDRTLRLFAHVVGSARVWLTRLEGRDSSHLEVWPTLDLEGCAAVAAEVHAGLEAHLDALDEALLSEPVAYRNQAGAQFTTRRDDVLTHLFLHASYHRGQIALALRTAGREPVSTDHIVWVREQAG
jgi:uncharacterized damage-inducible protein DinB